MKHLLTLAAASLLATACTPSTPQSRIARNPSLYEKLPAKQQQLVQQGDLAKGMSQEAVFLAWGHPSQRFDGFQNSKPTSRWDYSGAYPVYTNHFYGGYGYGRYGRYGYPYGFGQDVAFIPYRRASVWFVDNVVDSWERTR